MITTGLRVLPALATIALLAVLSPPARGASGPRDLVKQATDEVLVILSQPNLSRDQKVTQIEAVAGRHFDFTAMARLSLGRPWNDLDDAQRAELVREFQKHLSVTYGRNVERFDDQRIEITGDREEARGDWTVKTKVVDRKGEDVLIDYRLRQDEQGQWKVIDVIVEGVGLISNFRDQFQSIAAREGAPRVIVLLREKNARGESLIADPKAKGSGG